PLFRATQATTANASATTARVGGILNAFATILTWAAAGLLARRNVRQGRGDRRGAFRLSVFIAATYLAGTTIGAHHPGNIVGEIDLIRMLLALTLFTGAGAWLMYMAIEPYLRRIWPEMLIGWTRVLTGRFRDPRVGRDVLIGACAGIVVP